MTPADRALAIEAARRRHGPQHCVYVIRRDELPPLDEAPAEFAARGVRCAVCGRPARPDDLLVLKLEVAP